MCRDMSWLLDWYNRHRPHTTLGGKTPDEVYALAALVMVALAFGVFYLFVENAFLRAQQADPTLTRIPGLRHEALDVWSAIGSLVLVAGVFLFVIVNVRARGLSLRTATIQALRNRPLQPLDERTRSVAIGGGLILVGYGVLVLAKTIHAHVWEGESIFRQVSLIYLLVYFGLVMIGFVIRDYRLVHYGMPSMAIPQLIAEQIEPIRRSLEDHNLRVAVKRYREAVPGAGWREANRYVIRLFQTLQAQEPDKYGPPPMSLATLNWKALLIWALILAVMFGAWWFSGLPPYPASALSQFVYSSLFGMGLIASLRVQGFWTRLLVLTPALAVMIFSETVVPLLTDAFSHFVELHVWGFFYGILLMLSAFHPRRRSN
jgi:hypothetical protein